MSESLLPPSRLTPETHLRGEAKVNRIPVKVEKATTHLPKPKWIRIKAPQGKKVQNIKRILRQHKLSSVCEEALCPNLGECFSHGTATFMIMGDICTRRCPFCDVAHGKPLPLDSEEPRQLALAVADMRLSYVVITSVDRDDLRDGGARHYARCITEIRQHSPETTIEILVPDFRKSLPVALQLLTETPPDVFNHNIETVPRIYKQTRPGADYHGSLELLKKYKDANPKVMTKSGLMLGLGEQTSEILKVMHDLRAHHCNMLTIGQYLQPGKNHLPVKRYVSLDEFKVLEQEGIRMGFSNVASGPMVRSSYHADQQAKPLLEGT